MSVSTPNPEDDAELSEFISENQEFLTKVLAHGDSEARGYVLAVLANGATVEEIEAVQRELNEIRRDLAE